MPHTGHTINTPHQTDTAIVQASKQTQNKEDHYKENRIVCSCIIVRKECCGEASEYSICQTPTASQPINQITNADKGHNQFAERRSVDTQAEDSRIELRKMIVRELDS